MKISKFIIYAAITILISQKANAQWNEVGAGATALNANENISAITTDAFSNVYVAGIFSNASGKKYVAKWNGTNWSELGTGASALNANGSITCLTKDSKGNIYAAGHFKNAGNKNYVAKWDGTNWSELGTGSSALNASGWINCLSTDAAGNIYAAGAFTNVGPLNNYVAKWDGSSWSEIGGAGATSLKANSQIMSVTTDAAGNVYAAGVFSNSSGHFYVAKWDGTNWTELGNLKANAGIYQIALDNSGNLYAVGDFTNVSGKRYVAKWNGTIWSELGTLNVTDIISSISISSLGKIYVGGIFKTPSTYDAYVTEWNGSSWSVLGTGVNALKTNGGGIWGMAIDQSGFIYVTGTMKNSASKSYVAKYSKSLAVSEISIMENNINFYPNPFTQNATLRFNSDGTDAEIAIFNCFGQNMFYKKLEQSGKQYNTELNLDFLNAGTYWLKIKTGNNQFTQQINKQN